MKTKKLQNALLAAIISAAYFYPLNALAQINCKGGDIVQGTICVPGVGNAPWSGVNTFSEAVNVILTTLIMVVGLIAVLFIVIGGYKYVTAGGDEEKVKNAKQTIFNALIGVGAVLLALAIVRIVANAISGSV